MRIILVGAAGDIGRAAHEALAKRHEIIAVGRSSGDIRVDIADMAAVRDMYLRVGRFDAVVSCAGDVTFAPLADLTQDTFMHGLRQKVMGQVNLVLAGLALIADGGSFTLTSGVLDRDPIPMGTSAATANGALAGFVTGAAIEMPRGVRVNVVSPGLLEVSAPRYGEWFPGHRPVASEDVGRAFVKSVEGALNGQVIIVG
ncbi:short chain dehydrogenase [Frigidibacter sp.]|uniref:short chain dehydrogenase n=1 Tax=Frigidibacter sp. TaxID=2586418 RepID=UPI00273503D6|nr:short chain dehydrogenase [Frigidibacter sp.]MDP3340990.1 short chain dehydrogenase [Frigidibacter sp.]